MKIRHLWRHRAHSTADMLRRDERGQNAEDPAIDTFSHGGLKGAALKFAHNKGQQTTRRLMQGG